MPVAERRCRGSHRAVDRVWGKGRDTVTEFVYGVQGIRKDALLDMDREHARAAGLELDP